MTKISNLQLSLIAESDVEYIPVGDWDYDDLGTDKILVPNFPDPKLGTDKILVPNFPDPKLGTKNFPVPNFPDPKLGTEEWSPPDYSDWKPPIGCLDRKWIKDHRYWCWRYYDIKGKKRSIHLHKDYNKAIRKAMKIGVPLDAKPIKIPTTPTNPQTPAPTQIHPLHLAPTAARTSGNTRAA